MRFRIHAILTNGVTVFDGTFYFIPQKGDELEVNGYKFIVKKVTYVMQNGTYSEQPVKLLLEML